MRGPARGELCWAEDAELGRRPCLVLTRDEAIPVLNALVVAPVTPTVRGIPTEVPLGPDDGMPVECAATFDNVRPVRKSSLTERIGLLDPLRHDEVCTALAAVAACWH